jgi:hypothetical protein
MAGKTLTGIGEDESGKHELAADQSDSGVHEVTGPTDPLRGSTARPTDPMPLSTPRPTDPMPLSTARPTDPMPLSTARSTDPMPLSVPRSTDRMPMSTIIGAAPFFGLPELSADAAPTVDEDKVAEGLKKLRSLDEPLGPIPSSMPTLKEGIPAFGAGPPTPATPAVVASVAASELIRSRGTSHGHALSAAGAGQAVQTASIDDRMKGTLLGHSLHLPDVPEVAEELSRPAEVRAIARVAAPGALMPGANADFSNGDARFFDSEPVPTGEFEPERPRANKMMIRGLIAGGVASVFIVAAVAWLRSPHKSDGAEPLEAQAPVLAAPVPVQPSVPAVPAEQPVAPAPTAEPPAAAAPAVPPSPAPAAVAPPPPAPPEEAPPAAAFAAPIAPVKARTHHEAPAPGSKPVGHPATATTQTRAARPGEPARATTKPAVPGKHAKVVDDPDGTLPLDE